jgi:hypothetical protein
MASESEKQRYWAPETRAYAERLKHGGNVDYTINIPGIQDVVRIGAYESKELKRQRWLRYQATKNPAPAGAQSAARLLNWIDDAQDLLFTALALAWPLLRRLPLRMLPGLGWVLAVNDILNLMTCMLGFIARPGITKPECFNLLSIVKPARFYKAGRAAKFLAKFPTWGFVLQAPQALFTVTRDILGLPGYGVLPGPIMGMLSDFFWGLLRSSPGTAVRFNGPPPADISSKAMRYLLQPPYHHGASQAFSLEDHLMLSAATSIASQILTLLPMTDDMPERGELLLTLPVPVFTPWTESSLEVALEVGWDPGLEARDPTSPDLRTPTYGDVLRQITLDWHGVEGELAIEHGSTTLGTVNSMLVYESGDRILNWLNGGAQLAEPVFSQNEITFARQFEFQIFPPEEMTPLGLEHYLTLAIETAHARGAGQVSIADLQTVRDQFFPSGG